MITENAAITMPRLKKIFADLRNSQSNNCYYYPRSSENNDQDEVTFIKNYFGQGEKSSLIASDSDISDMRYQHMYAVFLIGIYIYDGIELFKASMERYTEKIYWLSNSSTPSGRQKLISLDKRKEFLYLWYLTALYHDFGYASHLS